MQGSEGEERGQREVDADGRGKEAKGSGLLELKGEAFTGLPGWTREGEEDLGAPSARKQCRPCQGCLHEAQSLRASAVQGKLFRTFRVGGEET